MSSFIVRVFTGSAVGVISMCLMIAGKQADRELERCTPKPLRLPEEKRCIHFINIRSEELFSIPDGGCIELISGDGEKQVGRCRYLDETCAEINGRKWQMQTFAEQMEARGIHYVPFTEL